MTPIYLNSSSNNYSPYPSDEHKEDHLCNHQFLSPNSQASSSSNSLTTHLFLSSTVHDQNRVFNRELQPPQHQHEGDNFGPQANNDHRIENNHEKDLKFSTWKSGIDLDNDQNQVKWMSSKLRVMLKMKKSDHPMKLSTFGSATSTREVKLEDHKLLNSPMEETDNSSNSTSSNNMPIRVCSDCNTTKTPLWRSGPRGPKSLCNACGIRQRKARRALAAAATAAAAADEAENGNTNIRIDQSIVAPLKAAKTQHKDHKKPSNGHVTKYKKRQYSKQITAATPSPPPSLSSPARKNCVEEFVVSLSKNLTLYRVFPQDEKEAAILLMALSCGYAHDQT